MSNGLIWRDGKTGTYPVEGFATRTCQSECWQRPGKKVRRRSVLSLSDAWLRVATREFEGNPRNTSIQVTSISNSCVADSWPSIELSQVIVCSPVKWYFQFQQFKISKYTLGLVKIELNKGSSQCTKPHPGFWYDREKHSAHTQYSTQFLTYCGLNRQSLMSIRALACTVGSFVPDCWKVCFLLRTTDVLCRNWR